MFGRSQKTIAMMMVSAMSAKPKRRIPSAFRLTPMSVITPSRPAIASGLVEGGAEQALFRQLGPVYDIGDLALVEDIDPVAEEELVVLGRIPEETASRSRGTADLAVKLPLGADIDAA